MQCALRPILVSLPALLAAACTHGSGDPGIPVFFEEESNDFAFEANDFGVLGPHEELIVRGHITDDGSDPFDGFAFVAPGPVLVDFALFADHPNADFDVCVFDPQIGELVACFATAAHPELGSVEVLAGGLGFHLVVESFLGASSYDLEIRVSPLFLASADEAPDGAVGTLPAVPGGIRPVGGSLAREALEAAGRARSLARYAPARAGGAHLPEGLSLLPLLAIDLATGHATRSALAVLPSGEVVGVLLDEE